MFAEKKVLNPKKRQNWALCKLYLTPKGNYIEIGDRNHFPEPTKSCSDLNCAMILKLYVQASS